jgi:hypothetical protein
MTCGAHLHREREKIVESMSDKWRKFTKKPYLKSATSPGQWGPISEIVLSRLKTRISAHCNKFSQNRWFFAILPNSGGFPNFPHKCDGFLELTRVYQIS